MKLADIAHSRSGDKGDTLNISLIAYDEKDYRFLREVATPKSVAYYLRRFVRGDVERYELPQLGALNFVLHRALGGGVTRSLAQDRHGKTMSSVLLEMPIKPRKEDFKKM